MLYRAIIGFLFLFLCSGGESLAQRPVDFCAGVEQAPLPRSDITGLDRLKADLEGGRTVLLHNGIEATIYPSQCLGGRLVPIGDGGIIPLDGGRYLAVIMDVNDPAIANKGDGAFHPFEEDQVIRALDEIAYPGLSLKLTIYILPYPRRNVLVSSASGSEIFLSPHVRDIPYPVAAYIVTHETGHVFQSRFLPDRAEDGWAIYRRLRGIGDTVKFSASGPHSYRPKEIFAEDFRVLFGGEEAKFNGIIENPELPSPLHVSGLEAFFLSLAEGLPQLQTILSLHSAPNPFNPQTEIRVELATDFLRSRERLTIRVYDVTGALVRELYNQIPDGWEIRVGWDGRDRNGQQVASSTYFALVQAGGTRETLKLLMMK